MTTSNNTNSNETKEDLIINLINDYDKIESEIEFARDENLDLSQLENQKKTIINELAENVSEISDYNVLVHNAHYQIVKDVMGKQGKIIWTMVEGVVIEVADEEYDPYQ